MGLCPLLAELMAATKAHFGECDKCRRGMRDVAVSLETDERIAELARKTLADTAPPLEQE